MIVSSTHVSCNGTITKKSKEEAPSYSSDVSKQMKDFKSKKRKIEMRPACALIIALAPVWSNGAVTKKPSKEVPS